MIAFSIIPALAAAQTGDSLRSLYDQHRYFELRDAIKGQNAPALYVGTVASAFNNTKRAGKYLRRVIKLEPTSDNAYEAYEQLACLYARLGRNREAVQQFNRMLAIKPNSPDVQNVRPLFSGFSRYPDQSLGKKHSTRVRGATVPLVPHRAGRIGVVENTHVSLGALLSAAVDSVTLQRQFAARMML